MPLPDTPAFNSILGSLTLREPSSSHGFHFRTCLADESVTDQGLRINLPGIVLWWAANSVADISPEALVRKIEDLLKKHSLPLDAEAVWCLLATFGLSKSNSGETAVRRFNRLFDCIHPADLNQYRIQHSLIDMKWNIDLEEFHVGPINKEQIQYRCRKAGSNFAELYLKFLPDHAITISRKPRRITMIDQASLADAWGTVQKAVDVSTIERLFNRVATAVSQHYFTVFDQEFETAQEILTAMGAGFISVTNRYPDPHQYTWLSVYLMTDGKMKGWVSPAMIGTRTFEIGRPDLTLKHAQHVWINHYGMDEARNHPAFSSLDTYCHFLYLSQMHFRETRYNEAFLHLIIALDLLLGSKEGSTESVSKRTAIIVFRGLKLDFQGAVKRLKTMYDARSRYVHAGQKVDGRLWEECEKICREVAIAYVSGIVNQGKGFSHEKWVKQLDVLIAQQDLGVELPSDAMASAGISNERRIERFDSGFSDVERLALKDENDRSRKYRTKE